MIVDTERLEHDDAYREDMRHLFWTDGFFAAEVLGFHDFSEKLHAPVFKGLYFPKNPNVPMREQHRKHKRIHMDPRHTFKTIAKRIDRLQWITAFPEDLSCLIESATQPLAQAVAEKSAAYFFRRKGASATLFHRLFEDLVVDYQPKCPWNTRVRRSSGPGDMDSTLDFTSPKTQQSGWHPFLIEPDDVEDANNSGIDVSADVREHVINVCDQNENCLQQGGFINICGTRYHPLDWYGRILKRAERNPDDWEVLVRCSVKRLDGSRLTPGEFPAEEECGLQFPGMPNLSYSELADKFYTNFESFMCQQQNDPQGGAISRFEERFYTGAQITLNRIPKDGETYLCWRPRYGGKKNMAKYSEGVCCRIVNDRIYVIDAFQGTYTPTREAEKIVFYCRQNDVDSVMLMSVPGSDYLKTDVRNEAIRKNRSVRIQYAEWEIDDAIREKAIEQLEPLMRTGRVMFSTSMTKAAECRSQFLNFGLIEENGIIECISKFAELVPLSVLRANMTEEELYYHRSRRDDALLSQFIDQQGLDSADEDARIKTKAHLEAMANTLQRTPFAMPPLPGGLDG